MKSVTFMALSVMNALRNFPEIVHSVCFEVQTRVFGGSAAFSLVHLEYSGDYCAVFYLLCPQAVSLG